MPFPELCCIVYNLHYEGGASVQNEVPTFTDPLKEPSSYTNDYHTETEAS